MTLCLWGILAGGAERFDFRTTILPIITKAGCNAGACHGAATGQGGFKLSLLGYDPEEDHLNITREQGGRRIDLALPAESLVLRKPLHEMKHKGGRRVERDSAAHRTLLNWISAGAPYGPRELMVNRIDAAPSDILLASPGDRAQLRVTAFLSNGATEDVTSLALYTSNDDAIADADAAGQVTGRRSGLTSIMMRYSGQVAAARIAIPFRASLTTEAAFAAFTPHNSIDEKVFRELHRLRLIPSPLSDDTEFFRRVHLDLAGRLPNPGDVRAFLKEPPSREKRERIVSILLASRDFVDFWTMLLADLLLISGKRGSEQATLVYHAWLREQVERGTPFDRIARELLTAQGDLTHVGPANFFTLASDPRDLAEHVGGMFLGTRIACARCHAHPSDRWTQEDYHRFAAYFARIGRNGNSISVSAHGEVEHPKTQKPLSPRPLGAQSPPAAISGADRRLELAAWITSPDNPFFARAIVNRVWKHLLGRGLVEPADDLRPTNPPAIPALLDVLTQGFVTGGYDLRRLIHAIATSRTYQLTSRALEDNLKDDRLFSHAFLKPLSAQVLADAVAQATGVPDEFPGYSTGTRAVELAGAQTPSRALEVLGRCPRERSCEAPGRTGGGLAQALHLINGSTINDKLGRGVITGLLARPTPDSEIITELYLRSLSRFPDPDELAEWNALLAGTGNRAEACEDLLWTLLNSREFGFNH